MSLWARIGEDVTRQMLAAATRIGAHCPMRPDSERWPLFTGDPGVGAPNAGLSCNRFSLGRHGYQDHLPGSNATHPLPPRQEYAVRRSKFYGRWKHRDRQFESAPSSCTTRGYEDIAVCDTLASQVRQAGLAALRRRTAFEDEVDEVDDVRGRQHMV